MVTYVAEIQLLILGPQGTKMTVNDKCDLNSLEVRYGYIYIRSYIPGHKKTTKNVGEFHVMKILKFSKLII